MATKSKPAITIDASLKPIFFCRYNINQTTANPPKAIRVTMRVFKVAPIKSPHRKNQSKGRRFVSVALINRAKLVSR